MGPVIGAGQVRGSAPSSQNTESRRALNFHPSLALCSFSSCVRRRAPLHAIPMDVYRTEVDSARSCV